MTANRARNIAATAARSAELLRKLDEGQAARRAKAAADGMTHSPTCEQPGTTTSVGHSVVVVRCSSCKAVTTTRRNGQDAAGYPSHLGYGKPQPKAETS